MWNVNSDDTAEGGDCKSSFLIHHEYISGLQWLGQGSAHAAVTSSYDGSVRVLDMNTESFNLIKGLPDDIEISALCCAADGG